MAESIHKKLERVRKPRVHITYDVETDGGVQVKELPFVMGVLGDYSGNAPTKDKKRLEERNFIGIDRDNFNDIMRRMAPGLNFRAENTLSNDGSEMTVQLQFNNIEDFEPGKVVDQVAPLKKLLETRNKLRDLMTNIDKSANLEPQLEAIMQSAEKMQKLSDELKRQKSAEGEPSGEKGQ